jgi:glyoxylase-like metal-dependent hydrolase (beta-lactamase superfamily II)
MPELSLLPSTEGLADDEYHIYSLCYARNSTRRVGDAFAFTGHDMHDAPMPIDYNVWIVENARRRFLVDLGFSVESARARGRTLIHDPVAALERVGVAPEGVTDIVISHMHVDHAGNIERFPNATVHVQDTEVGFVTGRCMHEDVLRYPYELEDVLNIMRKNWGKQLAFHDGDDALFPGATLHFLPGHAPGLQAVRVRTPRGYVLLASDGSHFYPNAYNLSPFRITVSAPDSIASYRKMFALTEGPDFFIPGHDPKVRAIYPKLVVNGITLHALHESPSESAPEYYKSIANYADDYPLEGE